jgi:filamentous hemagglutinin
MLLQARKYEGAFDQMIYHTNSIELANHYSQVFFDAGTTTVKFVITLTN